MVISAVRGLFTPALHPLIKQIARDGSKHFALPTMVVAVLMLSLYSLLDNTITLNSTTVITVLGLSTCTMLQVREALRYDRFTHPFNCIFVIAAWTTVSFMIITTVFFYAGFSLETAGMNTGANTLGLAFLYGCFISVLVDYLLIGMRVKIRTASLSQAYSTLWQDYRSDRVN